MQVDATVSEPSHIRYTRRMTEVASRELRNSTRSLLSRVEAGEQITITVDGRPVAQLVPIRDRPRWISRADFVNRVIAVQADPWLADELTELAGDSTDELPPL
jgi:prevent-host-death family protein